MKSEEIIREVFTALGFVWAALLFYTIFVSAISGFDAVPAGVIMALVVLPVGVLLCSGWVIITEVSYGADL